MNLALDKIKQGRFFLKTAEEISFSDINNFRYCIEASIVAARSVTLLLQKQYSNSPDFKEWYCDIQNTLKSDPLSKFLRDKRNFILKQGTASVKKVTKVTISEAIEIDETIRIKVVGGSWKSRLRRPLPNLINSINDNWKEWKRKYIGEKHRQNKSTSQSSKKYYFEESEWSNEPAITLIKSHLDNLESVVNECKERFGDREDE